jgi:CRP-like cAMP-binding protein
MPAPLALAELPLFATVTHEELAAIVPLLQPGLAAPGTLLIAEGAPPGHPLYILRRGEVALLKRGADGRVYRIDSRVAPAVFGEMEVLAPRPAIAGVMARTPVVYAALSPQSIARLCDAGDIGMAKVLQNLVSLVRAQALALEARLSGCRVGRDPHAKRAPRLTRPPPVRCPEGGLGTFE